MLQLWLVQQVASSHAASEHEVEEAAAMRTRPDGHVCEEHNGAVTQHCAAPQDPAVQAVVAAEEISTLPAAHE